MRPRGLKIDYSYLDAPRFKRRASTAVAIIQQLSDYSRLLQYLLEYMRVQGQPKSAENSGASIDARVLERYGQDRDAVFARLSELFRDRKVLFAVTVIPTADASSYLPPQDYPVRNEWLTLATKNDVPFLDVEEEARAQVRATGRYLHGFGATMTGGHLNRFGNAVFAAALGARTCELIATNGRQSGALHLGE